MGSLRYLGGLGGSAVNCGLLCMLCFSTYEGFAGMCPPVELPVKLGMSVTLARSIRVYTFVAPKD